MVRTRLKKSVYKIDELGAAPSAPPTNRDRQDNSKMFVGKSPGAKSQTGNFHCYWDALWSDSTSENREASDIKAEKASQPIYRFDK